MGLLSDIASLHFPHLPTNLVYFIAGLIICHVAALAFWFIAVVRGGGKQDAFSQFISATKTHQK